MHTTSKLINFLIIVLCVMCHVSCVMCYVSREDPCSVLYKRRFTRIHITLKRTHTDTDLVSDILLLPTTTTVWVTRSLPNAHIIDFWGCPRKSSDFLAKSNSKFKCGRKLHTKIARQVKTSNIGVT